MNRQNEKKKFGPKEIPFKLSKLLTANKSILKLSLKLGLGPPAESHQAILFYKSILQKGFGDKKIEELIFFSFFLQKIEEEKEIKKKELKTNFI